MFFASKDLCWTFAFPQWKLAPHQGSVVEKEAERIQIIVARVFPQEGVVPQPTVEIFDHGTGAVGRSNDVLDADLEGVRGVSHHCS